MYICPCHCIRGNYLLFSACFGCVLLNVIQDKKALFEAARKGKVAEVRRLIAATDVNVDCTPHTVSIHSSGNRVYN